MKISKAVIPVAGKGTRFLPATKCIPKEMIPLINIPMIYYVVKEAKDAGIETIAFISSTGKESILDFFDRNLELEKFLEDNKKVDLLKEVQEYARMVDIISIRQKEQLGLGHAVNEARCFISKGEEFAVLLGDDLVFAKRPCIAQLADVAAKQGGSVIGVMEVPKQETCKYGIVEGDFIDDKTLRMKKMVEKPAPEIAPSNLATPGRYILDSKIFGALKEIPKGAGGEYQLTDAINLLCQKEKVFAHIFEGRRFDTGNPSGYLKAVINLALQSEELKNDFINDFEEAKKYYEL
jgi:UTP--glucose-1-phosphate uridylyltransferase